MRGLLQVLCSVRSLLFLVVGPGARFVASLLLVAMPFVTTGWIRLEGKERRRRVAMNNTCLVLLSSVRTERAEPLMSGSHMFPPCPTPLRDPAFGSLWQLGTPGAHPGSKPRGGSPVFGGHATKSRQLAIDGKPKTAEVSKDLEVHHCWIILEL